MSLGWISVHREVIDSVIYKDSEAVHLWLHILLLANHKDNKKMIGQTIVKIPRGSLLTGRKSLSEATGINESKVQRLLKLFQKNEQIEQQTFTKYRLVSITNYDRYQDSEQQANSNRTTSDQQVNTNNNDNNANNVNNDNKELKDLFDSFWQNYPKKSDKKKAETAFNRLPKAKKQLAILDCKTRYSATDKKFIPLATTYINGHRWDDEKEIAKPADKHSGFQNKDYQEGATDINSLEWMK